MKLFVLILNRTEKLDDLMLTYAKEKICGATIIESTGMAGSLQARNTTKRKSLLGSIRKYLNGSENKEQNHSNCNSRRPAGNYHSHNRRSGG